MKEVTIDNRSASGRTHATFRSESQFSQKAVIPIHLVAFQASGGDHMEQYFSYSSFESVSMELS